MRGRKVEKKDALYMGMAIAESMLAAREGQTPFGAVVLDRNGRLVAKGHNEARSLKDPAAHGEVVAIRNAWKKVGRWQRLIGGTLYTSCEPCLMCSFVIAQVGIARVVYAARGVDVPTYRPLMGSDFQRAAEWINAQPEWSHIEVLGDFMRDEAKKVLADFPWDDDYARIIKKRG